MGGIIENGRAGNTMNKDETLPQGVKWQCAVLKDGKYKSLSPAIHNAGYLSSNIADSFEYSEQVIIPSSLSMQILKYRNPSNYFRGISVGAPFKGSSGNYKDEAGNVVESFEGVMARDNHGSFKYLDEVDEAAKKVGAVNTIIITRDSEKKVRLTGSNTDVEGFTESFKDRGKALKDKKVVIYGAGGAALASIHGALKEGAQKIVVAVRNLDSAKVSEAMRLYEGDSRVTFEEETENDITKFDVVVNAISDKKTDIVKKMHADRISPGQIVVEWQYSLEIPKTDLELKAEDKGATVISGREILLFQALGQFEKFTGVKAPIDVMRNAVQEASTTT